MSIAALVTGGIGPGATIPLLLTGGLGIGDAPADIWTPVTPAAGVWTAVPGVGDDDWLRVVTGTYEALTTDGGLYLVTSDGGILTVSQSAPSNPWTRLH